MDPLSRNLLSLAARELCDINCIAYVGPRQSDVAPGLAITLTLKISEDCSQVDLLSGWFSQAEEYHQTFPIGLV